MRSRRDFLILGILFLAGVIGFVAWIDHRIAEVKKPTFFGEASSPVEIVWAFSPLEAGAFASSPTVEGETIYLSAIHYRGSELAGAVYAVDATTGKQRWKFDDDGRMFASVSSPAVHDGKLYVGEGMHANFRCRCAVSMRNLAV